MLVTLDCTSSQWRNIIKTSTETFPNRSRSALIRFCSPRTLSISRITIICRKAKHTASASGYCPPWCCWALPQVYLAAFWQSSDSWEQCFKVKRRFESFSERMTTLFVSHSNLSPFGSCCNKQVVSRPLPLCWKRGETTKMEKPLTGLKAYNMVTNGWLWDMADVNVTSLTLLHHF